MKEKLILWWRSQNNSIRKKIFRLMFFGSMTVFVFLGIFVTYGLITLDNALTDESDILSDTSAQYIENVTGEQITGRLVDLAQSRAYSIETELLGISYDTIYIANGLEEILKHSYHFSPVVLPDSRHTAVRSGEVYVHRGTSLFLNGESEDVRREIELASNVVEYFEPMVKKYKQYESSIFVGSRHGYIIAVDNTPGNEYITMTEEFMQSYEPTQRGWYKNTKVKGTLTFNDIYVGAEGFPSFTCSAPYEDANGFAGVVAIACSVKSVSDIVKSAVLGDSGISFVMNDNGKIMLSTRHDGILASENSVDLRNINNEKLAATVNKMINGEKGWQTVEIDGEEWFLAYAPLKKINWSFGTLISKKEAMSPAVKAGENIVTQINGFREMMQNSVINFIVVATIVFWSLLVVLYQICYWLTSKFVKPIRKLTVGVKEISAGNLDKKISISTGDELETLANSFNNMTEELQKYMANLTKVTTEREHIATELAVATNIQTSMLPHEFPFEPGRKEFDVYATMHAAKEVGGDFYDFYMVDDENLLITIADVSGKGVPAALFMVVAKTMLKNSALSMDYVDDLCHLMAKTNDQLCKNNDAMMFVTAFLGILNLPTGIFNYVNAGHNPPLIYRAEENSFEYIPVERNFVMGGMEEIDYKGQALVMAKNDRLILYTDGITEALNEQGELFGEERLLSELNSIDVDNKDSQALLADLKERLDDFVGNAEQSDDMTMLTIIYNGAENS